MSIRYIVTATIPFLAAVALVSNRDRQVQVLASDKSTVRATVKRITVDDPGESAVTMMTLEADEVLPGALQAIPNHVMKRETIQVSIPGTDEYETFKVLQISLD
jgi:hypothetical protein